MSSQPDAHSRMNGLRRCAYWRISRPQTIAAPNAAARRGLIRMVGELGTAPFADGGIRVAAPAAWARQTAGMAARRKRVKASRKRTKRRACLDVKFLSLVRPLHDEAEPGRCVLAHQLVDHPVGDELIGDVHAPQP